MNNQFMYSDLSTCPRYAQKKIKNVSIAYSRISIMKKNLKPFIVPFFNLCNKLILYVEFIILIDITFLRDYNLL